ncbi:hypothetical protein [Tenacibaculum sp.]|uniref:hypothetical protein n=1 Tax=Tenacibaculum sp. TaxID=1906242 RepID=UPI003AA93196
MIISVFIWVLVVFVVFVLIVTLSLYVVIKINKCKHLKESRNSLLSGDCQTYEQLQKRLQK